MPLIEPIIRPPSESESFLLQVTVGCSSNTCTFCGAYLKKTFRAVDLGIIEKDIVSGSKYYKDTRKVFLLDGNALVLGNQEIIQVLGLLKRYFPKLSRVSSYANGKDIVKRSFEELKDLSRNGLTLIYMGLESGSQEILNNCRKTSTRDEMIEAVNKAEGSGIKSSVIVLLGLGGKEYSALHVKETIAALNKMQPRYLSFLSLMLIPGTKLYGQKRKGGFSELSPKELLKEAHDIIEGLNLKKTIFRSNHASNYLPLEGRFPRDKDSLLKAYGMAINGEINLKPEFLRGL